MIFHCPRAPQIAKIWSLPRNLWIIIFPQGWGNNVCRLMKVIYKKNKTGEWYSSCILYQWFFMGFGIEFLLNIPAEAPLEEIHWCNSNPVLEATIERENKWWVFFFNNRLCPKGMRNLRSILLCYMHQNPDC